MSFAKHGIVAARKGEHQGGKRDGGRAVERETPKYGAAPCDLSAAAKAPCAAIEGELKRPQTVVRAWSEGAGDREFDPISQRHASAESGAEVPTLGTPSVPPFRRGDAGGDYPGRGEPPPIRGQPAGVSRFSAQYKQGRGHGGVPTDVERACQAPNAVAPKVKGVPPGPPQRGKLRRIRQAGGASLALPSPEVLGRMMRRVGWFDIVVGVLVARTLGTEQRAPDQLSSALCGHGGRPDRDGEPVGDLVTNCAKNAL